MVKQSKKQRSTHNAQWFVAMLIALLLAIVVSSTASAKVWTDQDDYSPGSWVTIHGDNSDGAGYLPGETVHVHADGPNGYTADCDATVDASGVWFCQIYLPDLPTSIGTYIYTATGQTSGVTQSGTFTDGNVKARTNASGFTFRLDWTRHNGTSSQPQLNCNAPASQQTTGFEPAVGFSGGTQFSDGVPRDSSEVLKAADVASDGKVFIGWTGETVNDTFLTRPDPHEICVPGNFTGSRTYVANYQTNVAPTVTRANATVTVNEGQTASNNGTWSDPQPLDTVTLSASVGTVTKNANGTWNWSYATTDGPAQSQTVTITATDNHGASSTTTFSLTVNNVTPTATFNAPASVNEGSPINLSLTSPSDPSSVDTAMGFQYAFDCGSGYGTFGSSNSTACATTDNGTRTVKGKTQDKDNGVSEYTAGVTINNVAPSVSAPADQSANEGAPTSFSLGSFNDPGVNDNPWAVDVDWGDGSPHTTFNMATQGALTAQSHTYADGPNTFTVVVKVTDKDDGSDSKSFKVTVANVAPTITSVTNNGPISEGFSATITVAATDPAGANDPLSYEFDCNNDGIYEIGPQAGNSAACVFGDNGSFTVNVRVSDGDGGVTTSSTAVTVNNVAPTASLGNNGPVNEASAATISFSNQSDPSSADTAAGFHYAFACNGGSLASATYANSGTSASTTCSFDDNGTYTVKGRIIDKDDGFTEYTTSVVVNNVPPTAAFAAASPISEGGSSTLSLTNPSDPSSADTSTGFHYSFACDGLTASLATTYGAAGTANTANCTFSDNGSFTVKGRIFDKDGGFTDYMATVTVNNVAPTASLGNNGPVDEASPATISFSNQFDPSTADTAAGFHYAYSCTNGDLSGATYAGSGTNASTSCMFDDNGTYTVKGHIIDKDGGFAEYTTALVVNNIAPTATFAASSPINEGNSSTVAFTNPSDPSMADTNAGFHYAYSCNNGDLSGATYANSGTSATTSCPFDDNGSYTVKGRIFDKDGGYTEYTAAVVVNNVAPTATLSNNGPVNEGSPATISFSGQSDPSSADTAAGFHYAYACDNSSLAGTTYANSGSSATAACTFNDGAANGTNYTVRARIIDKDGGYSEYTTVVTVNNVPPSVTAPANQIANEGTSTAFALGSFSDPGADSPWAVDVDWGDGSAHTTFNATTTGSLGSQSHTYADGPNTYTVIVKVTDKDGASDSKTFQVTVNNVAPSVTVPNDQSANEGASTAFALGSFSDPGINDGPWSVDVDWGDGSAHTTFSASTQGSLGSQSHTYADGPNTYTVIVKVTDKDSGAGTATFQVTVNNVAPSNVSVSLSATSINENDSVTLNGSFADPGTLDTHTIVISWGDGSPNTTLNLAAGVLAFQTTHQYLDDNPTGTASDVNNINVTVTDKDGGSSSGSTSITVDNVPPTAAITGAPSSSPEGTTISLNSTVTDPGTLDAFTYAWSVTKNGNAFASGSGSSFSFKPDDNGTYVVSLTVTDDDLGTGSDSKTIDITNVNPTATFAASSPINEGGSSSLSLTSPSDPSSVDTAAGFHYSFACDGLTASLAATYAAAGTSSTASCSFDDNGSYTVKGRIFDKENGYSDYQTTVTVDNVAPTATLSNNGPVNEGSPATISFSNQSDPSSADTSAGFRYAYSCSNGDLSGATYAAGSSTSASTTCIFNDNGTYTVKGRIIDKDNGYTDYQSIVTVNNVAPSVTPPTNQSANEGTSTPFDLGSFSDPGADSPWTVSVDWGDGSAPTTFQATTTGALGSKSHTYANGPNTYTIKVTVTDKDTASGSASFQVTVNNVAPTVAFSNPPTSADEGQTKTYSFTVSDPGQDTFTVTSTDCGTGGTLVAGSLTTNASGGSFQCGFPDGPASPTVSVQVADSDGAPSNVASVAVTVKNVAPTATLSNNGPVNEGSPATISFSNQSDPSSADTTTGFHYAYSCTNGDLSSATYAGSGTNASTQCTFSDNGSYTVKGRIIDKDGGFTEYTTVVTVNNVAPSSVNLILSANPIDENGSVTLSGSFTDPGTQDTHTVVINWGIGEGSTTLTLAAGVTSFSAPPHQYLDDNPTGTASDAYTINVTVTDKDGGSGSANTSVTVNNVAPVITSVTGPADPIAAGSPTATVSITANFTDVGSKDTHTCTFVWDDGTPNTTVTAAGTGNGSCTATHTYTQAGVYTVGITVTDDDSGSATKNFEFVVLYDPNSGFVTGGGWIMSPAGAYRPDPTLTGKANFGFVSKYQKGANVPTGQTEFQFKAGDLNFHSEVYQWLVVAGCKAQYKGTGTINGVSGYSFLLTAYDAQAGNGGSCSGSSSDRFRIKITNTATGALVYDNRFGVADDMDSGDPQAISGGNISIKSK